MRKYLALLIFSCFFNLAAEAQTELNLNYWGLKFGLNLPRVEDNTNSDLQLRTRVAFHAGAFKNFPINDKFSAKAELLYSERGGRKRPPEVFVGLVRIYSVKTSYLSLPVIGQYNLGITFFELGIEPAMQLNVNVVNDNPGISSQEVEEFWTSDYDLNAIFGIGWSDSGFEANIRYLPGLAKVSRALPKLDANNMQIGEERIGINHMVQVSVGYRITKNK